MTNLAPTTLLPNSRLAEAEDTVVQHVHDGNEAHSIGCTPYTRQSAVVHSRLRMEAKAEYTTVQCVHDGSEKHGMGCNIHQQQQCQAETLLQSHPDLIDCQTKL